jgi:hypothetical protein
MMTMLGFLVGAWASASNGKALAASTIPLAMPNVASKRLGLANLPAIVRAGVCCVVFIVTPVALDMRRHRGDPALVDRLKDQTGFRLCAGFVGMPQDCHRRITITAAMSKLVPYPASSCAVQCSQCIG